MESILGKIVSLLWGWPLLIGVVGVGLYFTLGSGFWQFRCFGHALRYVFSNIKREKMEGAGILSSFEAVSVATAGAIGVGNIGGVASAIALGGPGALFWMWITALVGMMTKMVEVTLAVHYRDKRPDGSTYGGPTYYLEKGWAKEMGLPGWRILAVIFGVGIFSTFFLTMQTYTVSEAISVTFNLNHLGVATVYIFLLWAVVLGGIPRVGRFASYIVPFMAMFYVIAGLIIILMNASQLPQALGLIFKHAFTPTAAIGGFGGATFAMAVRMGIARGVYSNEAGWGSSPMAHATASVDHPVKQGMWGIFEVFVDTIIVCSITGLVIVTTGAWQTGLSGAELTLTAFERGVGYWGKVIVTIGVFLFGWTTSTGWYSYYETLLRHAFRTNKKIEESLLKVYKYLYPIPGWSMVLFATTVGLPPAIVWLFADITTAIPTYVNLIAILGLSGKFFQLLRDYNSKYLGYSPISDTPVRLFFEE